MLQYTNNEIAWCTFSVLIGIFMRLCTTLHPYSGEGKPPMYGDYEAQRHWMEITVNLPMNQWYHNSSKNNLEYWGLDYPPLTAYHSYVCGLIAYLINPQFVELGTSRGYESEAHKLFMRYTVLVADLCIYIPSMIAFYIITSNLHLNDECQPKKTKKKIVNESYPLKCSLALGLLYPGLILIDHGHFQYNCVSLGFTIAAITFLWMKQHLLSAILFTLALNYKQMELYHTFPFFLYLLSECIPKPGESTLNGFTKLCKIAIVVLGTFSFLWLPFIFNLNDLMQVIHRLFPLARGLFEDKVGNIWCALNLIYKFKKYCHLQMVRYCTVATLTAILPSSSDLFLRPNIKKFIPALINSSLAFFLFSYQVHEKSILLAAIPALLHLPQSPIMTFWFLFITNFSMFPLFVKDGLTVAFLALTTFYTVLFLCCHERWGFDKSMTTNTFTLFFNDIRTFLYANRRDKNYGDLITIAYRHFIDNRFVLKRLLLFVSMILSMFGCFSLVFVTLVFQPPIRYPDLFTLAISIYSCIHFLLFFIYFNVIQFQIPQSFDVDVVNIKMKEN